MTLELSSQLQSSVTFVGYPSPCPELPQKPRRQPKPIEEGAFMPRELSTPLPQPVFNEGNVTPDPRQFKTKHPSDNQQYKEIEKLLTKDVVAFDQSRMQPGDVYSLAAALGPHGTESVQQIKQTGQIVFHCAGDT